MTTPIRTQTAHSPRPAATHSASPSDPSSTPAETGPDARLAEMSAASPEQAAVFERGGARVGPRPFNPPPPPRLISEAKTQDEGARALIREKNEARIRAYNDAYCAYLETFADAVKKAPSLERIRCFGEPVTYAALDGLPPAERGRYASLLPSPSIQNAMPVHDARGERALAAEGITRPGHTKVSGEVAVKVGGVHLGAGVQRDGHETKVELSAGASVNTARMRDAHDKMNDIVRPKNPHEEEHGDTAFIADVTTNAHGETRTKVGGTVAGVGGAVTLDEHGDAVAMTVYAGHSELTVGEEGMEGRIGAAKEIEVAGYEAEVEGGVLFGTHGDDMMLGLEGGASLGGVASVEASVEVEVALVSEKAARRAFCGDGFMDLVAHRAGGR